MAKGSDYSYDAQAKQFGKKVVRPFTDAQERKKNGGVTNAEIEKYATHTAKTLERGSAEWTARMSEFEKGIANLDHDMYLQMKKHDKWVKGKEKERMIEENTYYNYQLMHMCTMPLAQGISSDSVIECLGMYIGCMIASPEFRASAMQGMKDAHVKRLTKSAERLEKTIDRLEKFNIGAIEGAAKTDEWLAGAGRAFANTKLGQAYNNSAFGKKHTIDGTASERAAQFHYDLADSMATAHEDKSHNIGTRWKKHIQTQANYGVVPLNPNIYSMHVITLQVDAYNKMRMPGADIDNIEKDLQKAIDNLNTRAYGEELFKDPAGLEALARNTRHMTEELMQQDPELQKVFQESSYGEYDERDMTTNEVRCTHKLYHGLQDNPNDEAARDRNTFDNEALKHEYHEVFMGEDYDRAHYDGSFFVGTEIMVDKVRVVPDKNNPGATVQEHYTDKQVTIVPFTGHFHVRRPERNMDRFAGVLDKQIASNLYDSSDAYDFSNQMSDWRNKHLGANDGLGEPVDKSEGTLRFEQMYDIAERCAMDDAGFVCDPDGKPYNSPIDIAKSLANRIYSDIETGVSDRTRSAASCKSKMKHNSDVMSRKSADAKAGRKSKSDEPLADISEREHSDYNWVQRTLQKAAEFRAKMFNKSAQQQAAGKHRGEDVFENFGSTGEGTSYDASADYQG